MSICKVIEITDCTFITGKLNLTSCTEKQLPAHIRSQNYYGNFWNASANDQMHGFELRHIVDSIHAWNEANNSWTPVFDSIAMSMEKAQFARQMYHYSGSYTLLCNTLQKDIGQLGPMLKFHRRGKPFFKGIIIS
jgi:hypothetical protein